jgi:DNA-binding NarL/FixJ family response regulator
MREEILLISRSTNNQTYFKTELEQRRHFPKVLVTDADKDGLNFLINDLKPKLVIIGAGFYYCSTAYMMSQLLKKFPDLNIAAVSISPYPADLAMWFIFNGVKSYFNFFDSAEEFFKGLDCIRDGKKFVSHSVQERIDMMGKPMPATKTSMREIEVIKLVCNGFTEPEISDTLFISERTVTRHKENIYEKLNVRNEKELIGRAINLGYVKPDQLIFHHKDYELRKQKEIIPAIRRVK